MTEVGATAEGLQTAVPAIPRHASANLRRAAGMAVPVAAAAMVVLSILGHPLAGILVLLGMAVGCLNTHLTQRAVAGLAAGGEVVGKKRFIQNAIGRMAMITVVGVVPVLFLRPDGLGVLGGIAAFQILLLLSAAWPMMKEYRRA